MHDNDLFYCNARFYQWISAYKLMVKLGPYVMDRPPRTAADTFYFATGVR